MRHLGVLPSSGKLQPTDKIPIGSYIQDIEETFKKTIDPVTGRMFMKHNMTDDLRDKRVREKAMVDRKHREIAFLEEDEGEDESEAMRQDLIREMELDQSYAEFPSKMSREWAIAQGHILLSNSRTEEDLKEVE